MKKLSVKTPQTFNNKKKLRVKPIALSYNEKGSFLILDDKSMVLGTCINCKSKPCIEYVDKELSAPFFNEFPHNTSKRVCPTSAISVNIENGRVNIDNEKCIACGLCLHRCPTAAIQLDVVNQKVIVLSDSELLESCTDSIQESYVANIKDIPHLVSYSIIPESVADNYQHSILQFSRAIQDMGEIIVRNTMVNMGIPTNAKARGNNYNRTEFFGQQGDDIIIGETNCNSTDVLTISRRILDDEAIMIGRYKKDASTIVPLSVINGLPNKRTDYYEVVYDIKNVLKISVSTITFYVLFILNLFDIKLTIEDFKLFTIDHVHQDLVPIVKGFIKEIETIDKGIVSSNYRPVK